jgi:hypothetical protein
VQAQCPEITAGAGGRWLLAIVAALVVGCASGAGSEELPPEGTVLTESYELRRPTIEAVSPSEIALGDRLQVFGRDFVHPDHGSLRLVLTGTFHTAAGDEVAYDREHVLEVQNGSLAELAFEELPVDGAIGTFYGSARLVARADVEAVNAPVGTEKQSAQIATTLTVLPSIEVTTLRSVDSDDCPAVTPGTNAGSELAFGVRVVGLGEGTPDARLSIRVGFVSPALAVTYVKDDVYSSWPLDWHPGLHDTVAMDAPAGRNTMSFELESGDSIELDPRSGPIHTTVSPPISIRNEPQSEVLLGRMLTGAVEAGLGPMTVSFFVEADRAGQTASRVVDLRVQSEFEVKPFDGSQRLVERYAPEIPAGQCGSCLPGGDIGRDINYTEGESASRTKSVSMRWDVNTANSVGLTAGHMVYAQAQLNSTWSSTFGTDVSEAVTTEEHRSLNIQAHVLPTFYGLCYRQLSRYEKTVDVTYHGECGSSAVVGQAVLTDWGWGFDVATGPECPPTTNLPEPLRAEEAD